MGEFSLEKISEKIYSGQTKEYFYEVLSSYQNGNYRSAVVMLWSVVICDIVYKLQHLVDLYDDKAARAILDEIARIQNAEPTSSSWEVSLVDNVHRKTNLLENADKVNLEYLQKQRHLCAHPVIDSNKELHAPSKDVARSLLRSALEGVLIKPPFYTQKILGELLSDVSENKEALNSKVKIKKYVENRYLERLKPESEAQVYRSLWKLVFKLEDEECQENRAHNLVVLQLIGERNPLMIRESIRRECEYYSSVAPNGSALILLVNYLSRNPDLFELLNEEAHVKVRHCIDTENDARILGWFVKDDKNVHFQDLLSWIEGDERPRISQGQWDELLGIEDSDEWQEKFCKLIGAYYGCSRSYNQADKRFQSAVKPHLKMFGLKSLKFMLGRIERNDQTYGRGRASFDHSQVKEVIDELSEDFEFSDFPNFKGTVEDFDDE